MIYLARISLILAVSALLCGCSLYQVVEPIVVQVVDCVDETAAGVRDDVYAELAWMRWHKQFRNEAYCLDFGEGFKSAYVDVLNGGSGEAPALPPHRYWRRWYECAEGREMAQAWFTGYYHGGIAAQQDGAGIWYATPLNLPPEDDHHPLDHHDHDHGVPIDEVGAPGLVQPPPMAAPEPDTATIDEASPAQQAAPPSVLIPEETRPGKAVPESLPAIPSFEPPANETAPVIPNEMGGRALEGIPSPPMEPSAGPQ